MHVTWMQRRQRHEQAQTAQPLPAGAAQSSQTYKRTVEGPAGNVHSLRRTWRRGAHPHSTCGWERLSRLLVCELRSEALLFFLRLWGVGSLRTPLAGE